MNALTSITPKPVLSAALRYAACGMPVFPVKRDKKPFSNRELGLPDDQLGGFHIATTDPEVISGWYKRLPEAGVAMPTGPTSGLWVLDIDREKIDTTTGEVLQQSGEVTLGGGRQLFFLWQGERIRNRARDIGPGLDTRGVKEDGSPAGYGVLPPSPHLSGGTYRWENETPAVPAPPWLVFLATFSERERAALAKCGITGPEGFEGVPPNQWPARAALLTAAGAKGEAANPQSMGGSAADAAVRQQYALRGIEDELGK